MLLSDFIQARREKRIEAAFFMEKAVEGIAQARREKRIEAAKLKA